MNENVFSLLDAKTPPVIAANQRWGKTIIEVLLAFIIYSVFQWVRSNARALPQQCLLLISYKVPYSDPNHHSNSALFLLLIK